MLRETPDGPMTHPDVHVRNPAIDLKTEVLCRKSPLQQQRCSFTLPQLPVKTWIIF